MAATKTAVRRRPARTTAKTTAKEPTTNTPATARKKVAAAQSLQQARVPDMALFDEYVGRTVVKGEGKDSDVSDFDMFDYAFENRFNILMEGPTGAAKTSMALAYAAKNKMPFYAIPSNIDIEPSQLFGKFMPKPDGSVGWIDGPVTSIVRTGGLLLINEVNFMPDRVATVLFGLLDKRRQITLLDHNAEVIDAHPDLLVVADMNPNYEGTRPLNKAFRNRYAVQLTWGYDDNVESKLVQSASLRELANKLRADLDNGGLDTPCSTNMLMEFEKNYKSKGYSFAAYLFVSRFDADERSAVRLVLDTYKDRLDGELDEKARKAREAAERKLERERNKRRKELEALIDPVRKDKQRIVEVDDPDSDDGSKVFVLYDDEWGIEGRDWEWDSDDDDDYVDSSDAPGADDDDDADVDFDDDDDLEDLEDSTF